MHTVRSREVKTFIQTVFVGAAIVIVTGCAATKGYFVDRGRDAKDVFTATVGLGLGAKARVGPLHAGLLVNHDVVGLRDGAFGYYTLSMGRGDGVALEYEATVIPVPGPYREGLFGNWAFGYDAFMARQPVDGRRLKADYEVRSLIPLLATEGLRHQYCTQFEVVLGLGPSVRLGFNPGELIDFVLGWTTLDIFDDDLERQRQERDKVINGN